MDNERFVIIIVNSIPPYCYELNNILSLPDNFSYRFRYQKKKQGNWMPEIANPLELQNCNGLIVLRDFQVSADFVPIRKIYITRVQMIGDIVYIEYLLKQKSELSSDLQERERQLSIFNTRINIDINLSKYPNVPNQDLANLVFFGADYTYDFEDNAYKGANSDRDSNRWGNIIETIGTYKKNGFAIYKDSDFLKIIGIQDEEGREAPVVQTDNRYYYRLANHTVYRLVFLQRTFTGRVGNSAVIKSREVILKAGNPEVEPIIAQKDIMGKYDLIELTFRSNISGRNLKSYLILEISDDSPPKAPSLTIPVRVVFSVKNFVLDTVSVLVFIGLFLAYTYAKDIFVWFNKSRTNPANLSDDITGFKNILLPLMIVFGSNTFKRIGNIKEFIFGRINL